MTELDLEYFAIEVMPVPGALWVQRGGLYYSKEEALLDIENFKQYHYKVQVRLAKQHEIERWRKKGTLEPIK